MKGRAMASHPTLACVMGDMDLVRALGLAGIDSIVVAPAATLPHFSRHTCGSVPWRDPLVEGEELVETMLRFAGEQDEPPVLYYQSDPALLFVSRHRARLRQGFRFVLPDATLVEDLVDKARFQALAERAGLPVPAARRLRAVAGESAPDLDLRYPLVLKPFMRGRPWDGVGGHAKAVPIAGPADLAALWPRLIESGIEFIAQESIPGPETQIESHHLYVDERGAVAGEFTGRKIRTWPAVYGHSTALEITRSSEVAALGRELVARIGLRGVAKLDFKRGPDGRLHLLEINPRFTLWHHPGAVAGMNLPARVHADLAGGPRPACTEVRPGVRWSYVWRDARAARAWGVSFGRWLWWTLGCETKHAIAWDDPLLFPRAACARLIRSANGHGSRDGR